MYIRRNSIKSQASGARNVNEPRLISTVGASARSCVRVDQCVSAVRSVEVPVLVFLRSGCNHVTEVGGIHKVCETRAEVHNAKCQGLCGCNPALTRVSKLP